MSGDSFIATFYMKPYPVYTFKPRQWLQREIHSVAHYNLQYTNRWVWQTKPTAWHKIKIECLGYIGHSDTFDKASLIALYGRAYLKTWLCSQHQCPTLQLDSGKFVFSQFHLSPFADLTWMGPVNLFDTLKMCCTLQDSFKGMKGHFKMAS